MEEERGLSLEVYKGPQLRAAHRISMFEKKKKERKVLECRDPSTEYWKICILISCLPITGSEFEQLDSSIK